MHGTVKPKQTAETAKMAKAPDTPAGIFVGYLPMAWRHAGKFAAYYGLHYQEVKDEAEGALALIAAEWHEERKRKPENEHRTYASTTTWVNKKLYFHLLTYATRKQPRERNGSEEVMASRPAPERWYARLIRDIGADAKVIVETILLGPAELIEELTPRRKKVSPRAGGGAHERMAGLGRGPFQIRVGGNRAGPMTTSLADRIRDAMTAPPKRYQVRGVRWLDRVNGRGLLADDMGLGKTYQAIAYLALNPHLRPAIIECPATVKYNWQNELSRFAGVDAEVLEGRQRHGLTGDVWILNYDIMKFWLPKLLRKRPKAIIIDECHRIKTRRRSGPWPRGSWRPRARR
jgi:hypothetical protein